MNNKLLARIVAVASCVTMLGTVAFAADPAITEKTENDATSTYLSFLVGTDNADITVNENEDQITMMAYIVDGDSTLDDETTADVDEFPAYVDQTTTPMIALDQVGGSAGFGEIKVDESKLVEGKKVAVKLGCSSGTVTEFLIGYNEEVETIEVTIGDVNGDKAVNATDRGALVLYVAARNANAKATVNTENGTTIGAAINLINPTTNSNWIVGDVNGDGAVNATDRGALVLYVAARNANAKATVNTENSTSIGTKLTVPVE